MWLLIYEFELCSHSKCIEPFSAGVDFKRQNLTSKDVRFWRLMSNPSLKDKRFIKAEDPEHMYSHEVERAK